MTFQEITRMFEMAEPTVIRLSLMTIIRIGQVCGNLGATQGNEIAEKPLVHAQRNGELSRNSDIEHACSEWPDWISTLQTIANVLFGEILQQCRETARFLIGRVRRVVLHSHLAAWPRIAVLYGMLHSVSFWPRLRLVDN